MPVTSFSAEEIAWSQQVAARLRFIQADFADLTPGERLPYYQEEIARALIPVGSAKKSRYLNALAERFPAGFSSQPRPAEKKEDSPEALVEALVRIAPQLPKRTLAEFGLRLQQAGYMELKSTTLLDDPPPEFLQQFPLEAGRPVDLQRLYRLALVFAECYFRLEVLSWSVWRELAPQTRIRRDATAAGDLKGLSTRYLAGDTEVAAEQLKAITERTRQLVSGVLGSLGGAGRGFSARLFADFSPDSVLNLAKMDPSVGGFMVDEDKKCWRKYKQIIKDHTPEVIEEMLHQTIARSAEDLMRGLVRQEK